MNTEARYKVEHRGMVHASFKSLYDAVARANRIADSTVVGETIGVRFPDGIIRYRAGGRVVSVWGVVS